MFNMELNLKNIFFSILDNDKKARLGFLKTAHGNIETPVFMPVGTLGSVKGIFPDDLKKIGVQIILGNTYHLMIRPGENLINQMGGLQKFMSWDGPILTDSGGFQIWSLSKLRKIDRQGVTFSSHVDGKRYRLTPESSIKIQKKLNADISMVLDECTNFPSSYQETSDSLDITIKWAKDSKKSYISKKGFGLFSIIQGGMHKPLRKKSTEILVNMDFDGYAIGGLSVGETHKEMINIVKYTTKFIPQNKPRYLMGVGRPIDIFESVENGIDMFDCVLPTRFGRNGRAFTSEGEINLRNAKFAKDKESLDKNIDCPASKNFSRGYIHHLTKTNEILSSMILSLHNIAFYQKMMSDIRNAIKNKRFLELKRKYMNCHGIYEKA